ncbi:hypothetical protein AAFX24_28670 [Vibrio mediterranei]|uniref:hypothetical protein n=1 Tax=Vibrio mediterranei TaxID=689 RepID=UPI0038CDEBD3
MRTEHCVFCSNKADHYDFLTQSSYCEHCRGKLLDTPKHRHFQHVQQRLSTRYQIFLDIGLYWEALNKITLERDKTWLCKSKYAHRSIHKLELKKKKVFLVYDDLDEALITALPSRFAHHGALVC